MKLRSPARVFIAMRHPVPPVPGHGAEDQKLQHVDGYCYARIGLSLLHDGRATRCEISCSIQPHNTINTR